MLNRRVFTLLFLLGSVPAYAQRLPADIVPSHYDIAVTPNLQAATFAGTERIVVALKRPTTTVVLNSAEIEYDKVTVTSSGKTLDARVALDAAKEQATFTVERPLTAGAAEITIQYRGILNDQLRGLYLSQGKNRRYAVTQLEATDARRMFPSFDEPAFKATFSLSATIDSGDHAISNGAVVSDTPGPAAGKHTVKFETSPKMSTYLVALAVGDFECQSGSADGIPIRICSTPDKKGQTGLALEAAQEIIRYYNKYYAVKYPFKKLDVVAVPDFSAGAMENTAAIFYRETLLLADPKTASTDVRKLIAGALAHEMAHQWFGDLVTMKWWDDIWLNEGFATWMETKPVKASKPEWHMELDEVQSSQSAMSLDALKTTRPIRAEAWTPAEISELFDGIAYAKGGAVLRMVEAWLGEEAFRAGVNAYIDKFKYSNAKAEDFWDTLTTVTKKPVNRVMAGFVDRPGVPFVDVAVECSGDKGTAIIKQEAAASGASAAGLPTIPVCVKTASDNRTTCVEIGAAPATMPINACPAWVMANAGGMGYYRMVSPPQMVRALARDVPSFSPTERITLLSNEWALVRAGRHDVGTFLDLTQGFKNERSAGVMGTLAGRLAAINTFTTDESRPLYHKWMSDMLKPAIQEVGWVSRSDDTDERRELRASLFGALGETARDPEAIATARRLVESVLDGSGSIDSNLLNQLVSIAARGGDAALYDKYLARSAKAIDPEDHYRYLWALSEFSDPSLVRRTLDYTLGPDVRTQDAGGFVAGLLVNPDTRSLAWQLLRERWSEIQKKVGPSLGGRFLGALGTFCDARAATEVQTFFAEHPVPDASRTIQQAVERISTCAELASTQGPKLAEWLNNR